MDPQFHLQDVVRCDVCDTPVPPLHCDFCQTNLCKACIGDHMLDESKNHQVVPFKHRKIASNYPICPTHDPVLCTHHCKLCDISLCSTCVFSAEHQGHEVINILEYVKMKKDLFQRDIEELEQTIYPKHQEIAFDIQVQKTDLNKNSQKLTTAIYRQGKYWHKEVDNIVQNLKSQLDDMDSKILAAINRQEDEITRRIYEIKQSLTDLNKLLDSNDVSLVSAYKSRNVEFGILPAKLTISQPNFKPWKINKEELYQQFGILSSLSVTTEEYGYTMENTNTKAEFAPKPKLLLDEPWIITSIKTQYGRSQNYLTNVTCASDKEIWTCSDNNKIMSLYNLKGELVKSIQTQSGNSPLHIAVTRSGDLVYVDSDRTVNIMKDAHLQEVIKPQDWKPRNVCSTSSGDLLVVMDSDDDKHTRVVRYSDTIEKQRIRFSEKGQPLYLSGGCKYITENRNLDICVSDFAGQGVVVVNQAGKLRFTYTGPPSTTKGYFKPRGITTDSQGQILTADCYSHCIHILDQDGNFLRYIENSKIKRSWALCVDSRDHLFVAECETGKVKKIKYYL